MSQGRVHLNPDGKETRTEWEVLGSSVRLYWSCSVVLAQLNLVQPTVPLTLLRLKLLTGHKHQLRVHLAKCLNGKGSWIQRTMSFKVRVAPIVGDELYANDLPTEEIKAAETIVAARNKTFLHASEISLRVWMILTSHFPSIWHPFLAMDQIWQHKETFWSCISCARSDTLSNCLSGSTYTCRYAIFEARANFPEWPTMVWDKLYTRWIGRMLGFT